MRKISSLFLAAALTFPVFAQTTPKTSAPQTSSTAAKPVPADASSKDQLMKLFDVLGINKQIQSVVDSMAKTMQQNDACDSTDVRKAEGRDLQATGRAVQQNDVSGIYPYLS